jgi:putative ABC transport system permease protein
VLTGVFDPPPDALSVPWPYLAGLAVTVVLGSAGASALVGRLAAREAVSAFRDT